MKKFKSLAIAAAAMAALGATPAIATTFSFAGDFGNPVFQYGSVSSANVFTPFAASDCADIGVSGLCYRGTDKFQVEFQQSADSLLIHPGPNDGQNSLLMFTAPQTGDYTFNATFTRGDTGDGVNIYSFGTGGLTLVGVLNAALPTFTYSGTQFFTQGQQVGIGVDRGGPANNYFNDSTLLSGSITSPVPEPATWAMMLVGFGLLGAGMRRRSRTTSVRFRLA